MKLKGQLSKVHSFNFDERLNCPLHVFDLLESRYKCLTINHSSPVIPVLDVQLGWELNSSVG